MVSFVATSKIKGPASRPGLFSCSISSVFPSTAPIRRPLHNRHPLQSPLRVSSPLKWSKLLALSVPDAFTSCVLGTMLHPAGRLMAAVLSGRVTWCMAGRETSLPATADADPGPEPGVLLPSAGVPPGFQTLKNDCGNESPTTSHLRVRIDCHQCNLNRTIHLPLWRSYTLEQSRTLSATFGPF